jgi:hypothetical protein
MFMLFSLHPTNLMFLCVILPLKINNGIHILQVYSFGLKSSSRSLDFSPSSLPFSLFSRFSLFLFLLFYRTSQERMVVGMKERNRRKGCGERHTRDEMESRGKERKAERDRKPVTHAKERTEVCERARKLERNISSIPCLYLICGTLLSVERIRMDSENLGILVETRTKDDEEEGDFS